MPELRFFKRSKTNWTPVSYSADETANLFNVAAGDLIGLVIVRLRTAFNGTGGRTISLGDGAATTRFMTTATGDISQAAGTFIQGVGGGAGTDFLLIGRYLYTAADTVDVVFTAATGGSPTTGALDFYMWVAKVIP